MSLVGFFDILGTSDAVLKDRFSDNMLRDFVGAVGIAANLFPKLRFAAFSDCVIISADDGLETDFLKSISVMCGNWAADVIHVRGGIASGEIRWVDETPANTFLSNQKNLIHARVYGKALVQAYKLEKESGPGAILHISENAAFIISKCCPDAVFGGVSPSLCWATEREARLLAGYAQSHLDHTTDEGQGRRHALATKRYWDLVCSTSKFLPRHLAPLSGTES